MLSVLVDSQLKHALVWPNERQFLAVRSFHNMIGFVELHFGIIMNNCDLQDCASVGSGSRKNRQEVCNFYQ